MVSRTIEKYVEVSRPEQRTANNSSAARALRDGFWGGAGAGDVGCGERERRSRAQATGLILLLDSLCGE